MAADADWQVGHAAAGGPARLQGTWTTPARNAKEAGRAAAAAAAGSAGILEGLCVSDPQQSVPLQPQGQATSWRQLPATMEVQAACHVRGSRLPAADCTCIHLLLYEARQGAYQECQELITSGS